MVQNVENEKKTVLLFGSGGQLGQAFQQSLKAFTLTVADYPVVDFNIPEDTRAHVERIRPDVIINCAAYTDVDGAEHDRERAFQVNAYTVQELAEAAKEIDAGLVHFSTDYVFDGKADHPYREEADTQPLNVYGESKLAGEEMALETGGRILVFRLSWVYGTGAQGFVSKVIRWAGQNEVLRIVDDQVSVPNYAVSIGDILSGLLFRFHESPADLFDRHGGLYHFSGKGEASRYEWAKAILASYPDRDGLRVREVVPAKSSDFPSPAERPAYSVLDSTKFEREFGVTIPGWQDMLDQAMVSISGDND
jgi:dTDP-4-dehydrorhamnose reductase